MNRAFGDKITVKLRRVINLIEEFVQANEKWPCHISMRQPHLPLKILAWFNRVYPFAEIRASSEYFPPPMKIKVTTTNVYRMASCGSRPASRF
jgi:hypothetical protein